jgi:hypothetical protein
MLKMLGVVLAALLLFGMCIHATRFNKTGGWISVEASDEFVYAKASVPTVVNELDYVYVAVDIIGNIDLNVTVHTLFAGAIYYNKDNKDGTLTFVNPSWDGDLAESFNLRYGTFETIHLRVRPPDVAATSKQMFVLSVEYRPQRIEDVNDVRWKQWGVRTANSKIVEIQLQNSFLIPDSIMLASAILEFPILIFFIIPKSWKAIITRKLLR